MAVLSILVFAGALVLSVAMIAMAIGPQWQRIVRLAMGHVEPAFTTVGTVMVADRRITVRRWASAPTLVSSRKWRAAA
jgi:NADH:ubiquinone oxidoreductase subunit 6 (subunit J)